MLKRTLYLDKIKPYINKEMVKVITGIRRSGKSVLLKTIAGEIIAGGISKQQVHIINFESELIPEIKTYEGTISYLQSLMADGKRHYLFLDEVQELTGWEKIVNSLLIDYDVDIYITGSNARLLSGELATYLAGRYVEFKVYPFSLAECMELNREMGQVTDRKTAFKEYLELGGMPVIYQQGMAGEVAKQYLRDVYDSIILKDIVSRNKIRDVELLRRVILFLVCNIGNPFTGSSVIKYLKNEKRSISSETLYNYLEYCQTACFLHLTPSENLQGKNILSRHDKIYLVDHGLREAIYGNNIRDINQTLENIVYIELLRRGYEVTVGKSGAKGVDFIARKFNEKLYVQVSYLLASAETVAREFGVLERIPDNYPKVVLSLDDLDFSQKGIKHINIIDWLLETTK